MSLVATCSQFCEAVRPDFEAEKNQNKFKNIKYPTLFFMSYGHYWPFSV